eukprot:scpid83882/ scgid23686/ 
MDVSAMQQPSSPKHDVEAARSSPIFAEVVEVDYCNGTSRQLEEFQPPGPDAYMRLGALEAKVSHQQDTRDLRSSLSAPALGALATCPTPRRRTTFVSAARTSSSDHEANEEMTPNEAPLPSAMDKRNMTTDELLAEVENCKKRLALLRRISYMNSVIDDAERTGENDGDDQPGNPYFSMPSRHMSISEGELDGLERSNEFRTPAKTSSSGLTARYNEQKQTPLNKTGTNQDTGMTTPAKKENKTNLKRALTLNRATTQPKKIQKRTFLQRVMKKVTPKHS